MRIIQLLLLLSAVLFSKPVWADFNPTAYYTVDGESFTATDAINDGEAPLTVEFRANPSGLEGSDAPAYEWRFVREGSSEPYLTRYSENTTFEFLEAGSTTVSLYVSFSADAEPELISSIRVTISTSLLEMPNAFSPNGDGVNDIYRAKKNHKSIIEFHAYIFNRWGQKLFEWTDIDGGWDGTHNGTPVKAGVYFVLVKAKGADGRKYNIRRDVNLLRDYTEGFTGGQQ